MTPGSGTKRRLVAIAVVVAAGIAAVGILATITGCGESEPARTSTRRKTSTAGSGLVVVPGVIGVDQGQALEAFEKQGLKGVVESVRDDCRKPAGTILRQQPSGRTQAQPGTEVKLVASKRSPVDVELSGEGPIHSLSPGEDHVTMSRPPQETGLIFGLSGDVCTQGVVLVTYPPQGSEQYLLSAGEESGAMLTGGSGFITIKFVSSDPDARLLLRIGRGSSMQRAGWVFLLVLVLVLAVAALAWIDEPASSRGQGHPELETLRQGGDGRARHQPILTVAWLFGCAIILFFGVLVRFGALGRQGRGGLATLLSVVTAGHLAAWSWLVWAYRASLDSIGPELILTLPRPTAIMIFVFWPISILYSALFVIGFDRWVLTEAEETAFDRLVEQSRKSKAG